MATIDQIGSSLCSLYLQHYKIDTVLCLLDPKAEIYSSLLFTDFLRHATIGQSSAPAIMSMEITVTVEPNNLLCGMFKIQHNSNSLLVTCNWVISLASISSGA